MRVSPFITILPIMALMFGCGGSGSGYVYRAITDNCDCEEFTAKDSQQGVEYRFRASYKMDHGIATTIRIEFLNHSDDTLFLDPGMVRVSSRNVSYQYNDKFIPLPTLVIPPGSRNDVTMTGTDISQVNNWNKIAGEQLTITLKSIRLGRATLPQRSVVFVPVNPKLDNMP